MRCTCNRSVVPLTSASSTRRTKFRSLDQRCSRHLLYSPETEYFASARSNAMAQSSTTTAARAPSRKSESIWLSESGVINRIIRPASPHVSDRRTEKLFGFAPARRGLTSVILLLIQTAFRSWDNEVAVHDGSG